jgi:hypothetical protein
MSSRFQVLVVVAVMAITAVGRSSAMQAEETGGDRYPVPRAAEEEKALGRLRSLYSGAFKQGGMALAKTLEVFFHERRDEVDQVSSEGRAEIYVAAMESARIATLGGHSRMAVSVLEHCGSIFDLSVVERFGECLEDVPRKAARESGVAIAWLSVFHGSIARDNLGEAQAALEELKALKGKIKEDWLGYSMGLAEEKWKLCQLPGARHEMDESVLLEQDDLQGLTELGLFLCLVRNDWDRGLECLVGGADKTLARIAGDEVALRSTPHDSKTAERSGSRVDHVWLDEAFAGRGWKLGHVPAVITAHQGPVFHGENAWVLGHAKSNGRNELEIKNFAAPLVVGAGDSFFVQVFLDPEHPPRTLMLQLHSGSWEHRAYWGEDLIPYGELGTGSRFPAGELPETGKWAALEVPASMLDLEPGARIDGVAFDEVDGRSYWDWFGLRSETVQPGSALAGRYGFLGESWLEWAKAQGNGSLLAESHGVELLEVAARLSAEDPALTGMREILERHHATLLGLKKPSQGVLMRYWGQVPKRPDAETLKEIKGKKPDYAEVFPLLGAAWGRTSLTHVWYGSHPNMDKTVGSEQFAAEISTWLIVPAGQAGSYRIGYAVDDVAQIRLGSELLKEMPWTGGGSGSFDVELPPGAFPITVDYHESAFAHYLGIRISRVLEDGRLEQVSPERMVYDPKLARRSKADGVR